MIPDTRYQISDTTGHRPQARTGLLLVFVICLNTSALAQNNEDFTQHGAVFNPQSAIQTLQSVDRTVATVRSTGRVDLVTYSDLLWQLTLEPSVPLANPSPERLRQILRRVIDLRLIGQEAVKLPTINPTEKEITEEIRLLVSYFPTRDEFEARLQSVGFRSIDDEQFRKLIEQRVAINKYVNFRFYLFAVVTSQDVDTYYKEVFVPTFQRTRPGQIVPTQEQATKEIEEELRNRRVAADIDTFLEAARERAEIVFLYPELEPKP